METLRYHYPQLVPMQVFYVQYVSMSRIRSWQLISLWLAKCGVDGGGRKWPSLSWLWGDSPGATAIEIQISPPSLLSLSLSDSSVFFIRASPPSSILSLLSSRLPVLPPPDDSLLHEKNGGNFSTRSNVATDSGRGAGEPVALY